jgi:transcription termination factor Rho
MNLWPHQERTIGLVDAAIGAGRRKIVVAIPTGGGKTLVMQTLARAIAHNPKRLTP